MDLTPKQQTSEAIRQAENILIITGQRPSVDQTVSVLALTMILRKFGKQATAVVTDQLPSAVAPLANGIIDKNLGESAILFSSSIRVRPKSTNCATKWWMASSTSSLHPSKATSRLVM
ncbi:hypothetical protein IPG36_02510 [bacterium]|nr:MAG: hypothetical protein IPG36_02510 [bacterium]